jgi:hypothetical protein
LRIQVFASLEDAKQKFVEGTEALIASLMERNSVYLKAACLEPRSQAALEQRLSEGEVCEVWEELVEETLHVLPARDEADDEAMESEIRESHRSVVRICLRQLRKLLKDSKDALNKEDDVLKFYRNTIPSAK